MGDGGPLPQLADRLATRTRPAQRPAMYQTWRDLLFLHWQVEPGLIQATLPPGLTVDTFDGAAYVGIVPFYMRGIRPIFSPAIPGISNFLETNLRTYAFDAQGVPGVWFYSLEANQWLAVQTARAFFKLPYYYNRMRARRDDADWIDYHLQRRGALPEAASIFVYRGLGETRSAEPGSLEFFLAERYILFAQTRRGLARGRVYHTPYPLQAAEVRRWSDGLFRLNDLPAPQRPPDHALFSPGVSVAVFGLEAAETIT